MQTIKTYITMKRLFLLLALFGVLATGCEELLPNEQKPVDKPTEQPTEDRTFFTDVEGDYVVSADGGEVLVIIATNLEYSIAIPEEAQSWLSVADTRAEERIDKCTFIVARNDSFDERSATAELIDTEGKVLQTITFVQNGQPKIFETDSEGNYRVVANGGEVMVAVTTNLEYNIVISEDAEEWLSVADTRVVVREDKLTFVVAVNESFEERSATVELTNSDGEVLQTISFIQDGQSNVFKLDSEGSYTIKAVGGEVSVAVTTNLEYSVVISEDAQEWLSVADTRAVIREETLTFIVAENKAYDRRSTTVALVDNEDNVLQTIEFIQRAAVMPQFACPADEIWYTNDSTTEPTTPYETNVFGANILSNTYSEDSERWVIKFDGEVTTIGNYAFRDCSSLTSVTIPDSVTTIGESAFSWCEGLTSVTIPDSVTTIGDWAFDDCSSLESITIPDSITTIGDRAFYNCSSLTSVYITDLSAWCKIDFENNSANPLHYANNLYLNNEFVTDLVIPNDITEIKSSTFSGFNSLTSVTIGNNVTTIGDYAFYNCDSLTSVTIGDSVTSIGDSAFYDCQNLTSITIPNGVTTIGNNAFYNCDSLTSVTIPDNVTTIEYAVFAYCSSLTSVTIPDSVTSIGEGAFSGCSSLESVTIPNSVTTIGNRAFSGCNSLTGVTIPDSVVEVGAGAFSECFRLSEFNGKFASSDGRCLIINGTLNSIVQVGLTVYSIPDSVTKIGDYVFANCHRLTSITIPDSVTMIGRSAFYNCSSLTSVTIPNSVTTIGNYAFEYCI